MNCLSQTIKVMNFRLRTKDLFFLSNCLSYPFEKTLSYNGNFSDFLMGLLTMLLITDDDAFISECSFHIQYN